MNDLHYQVGNQKFFNKFQAAHHAYNTNQKVWFNMYETSFDSVNWETEPKQTWDELLDIRAHQIAAKNKPIILHFSGGTDSYTIYKVFERNNIHIDILYVRTRTAERLQSLYKNTLEFLNKGIYDPFCKIIIDSDIGDMTLLEKAYHSEDWIWDTANRYTFALHGGMGVEHEKLCGILEQDAISVIGFEKPRLHFESGGKVYSFQDDINYVRPMNCPFLECFYITPELPELHIKQSYMLKNYLKLKFNLTVLSTDVARANLQFDPNTLDWNEYSTASGRFGDLANSRLQHLESWNNKLIINSSKDYTSAQTDGLGKELFNSIRDTKVFKNFVNSMINVQNDAAGKYFNLSGNNLYNIPMIRSKYYQLTF